MQFVSPLPLSQSHKAELENEIEFSPKFTAVSILHPATYLNKALIGSQQGELQLWNTRTW